MEYRLRHYRGKWAICWPEGGSTRRLSLRTTSRAEAERRFADWKKSLDQIGPSVSEIMTAYLADRDATAAAPERLRDAWKALQPFFGSYRPDQVDRALCRAYVSLRREQGRKDGTIAKELRTLRAGLRWQNRNTPAIVEVPASTPPRDRYLTRAEYEQLISATPTPHVRLFIQLAIATGARAGAILDLTWKRIDMDRGIIHLGEGSHLKGRATVPMNESIKAVLTEAAESATTAYVIEFGGRKVQSVRHGFERACDRAGLRDVTPHVLRHTAAVWMAEAGIPMSEIAQVLGHTDTRVTERVYARYSPDYLRRAVDVLRV